MRPSKRDELVHKSLEVFYRNGFHATGMDLLVAETGVSKTSMYNHFRSKDELILAALRLRDERFRNWLYRRMEELGGTPGGQLLALFDALGEWFAQPEFRGCMFIKAAAEFQQADHPIRAQAAEHKRLILAHLRHLAEKAGARDADGLARQLFLLKEGATVAAQLSRSVAPAADARAAAGRLVAAGLAEGRRAEARA